MVFILCLGFFVTPAVLGGGKVIMVSMKIVSNIELFVNWGAASALGVVLLVLTMIILWVASRFLKLDQIAGGGQLMLRWLKSPATETQITHGQRLWLYVFAVIIMVLLVTPTLIVIPMSFSDSQYLEFPPETWSLRWYRNYFGSSEWMQATRTSFVTAFLTMLVATPVGTLAAYGLHASRVRFVQAAFVLMITPMMVPLVLVAIGAFYVYVKLQILYTLTRPCPGAHPCWPCRW